MKNINNTSNAIQIDYFDNIEIKLTSEVKNFHAGTISKNQEGYYRFFLNN